MTEEHQANGDQPKVLIVGCGIIGLSVARELIEDPYFTSKIILYADNSPLETTSCGAGGLWMPFHCEPQALVDRWSEETLVYCLKLIEKNDPKVEIVESKNFKIESEDVLPSWKGLYNNWLNYTSRPVEDEDAMEGSDLRKFPIVHTFRTPILNSPEFLKELIAIAENSDKCEVRLNQPKFESMEEVIAFAKANGCTAVFNCTGLGSKFLYPDEDMAPARGALLLYKRPKGCDICWNADGDIMGTDVRPAYVIPRGEILCAGGTFLVDDWNAEVTEEELETIERNAKIFCPELGDAKPFKTWVGFRPYRKTGIRFDRVDVSGIPVFNNYGHGGSGWTVHIGAARDTVKQYKEYLTSTKPVNKSSWSQCSII